MIGCCPLWYYQNAVACASPNNSAIVGGACWWPAPIKNPNVLKTTFTQVSLCFPIPFLPGTIIDKFCLKYSCSALQSRIDLYIFKRREDTNQPVYDQIFSELNITSITPTRTEFPITPTELEHDYSYVAIINTNIIAPDNIAIYSFGIHTTRRYL